MLKIRLYTWLSIIFLMTACTSTPKAISLDNAANLSLQYAIDVGTSTKSLAIEPQTNQLIHTSDASENNVMIWDLDTRKMLQEFMGIYGGVYHVAVSSTKKIAISGIYPVPAILLDMNTGKMEFKIQENESPPDSFTQLVFSSDSSLLITGGSGVDIANSNIGFALVRYGKQRLAS